MHTMCDALGLNIARNSICICIKRNSSAPSPGQEFRGLEELYSYKPWSPSKGNIAKFLNSDASSGVQPRISVRYFVLAFAAHTCNANVRSAAV